MLPPGEYTFSVGGSSEQKWLSTREYRFAVKQHWESCYDSTSPAMGIINLAVFGNRKTFDD